MIDGTIVRCDFCLTELGPIGHPVSVCAGRKDGRCPGTFPMGEDIVATLPSNQDLCWQSGDVYRTASGDKFQIIAGVDALTAWEGDFPHLFDLTGRAKCGCPHGDLVSRVTGRVA